MSALWHWQARSGSGCKGKLNMGFCQWPANGLTFTAKVAA